MNSYTHRRFLDSNSFKNLVKGMSTVLDIYPNKGYPVVISKASDLERLVGDWVLVGKDFKKAEAKIITTTNVGAGILTKKHLASVNFRKKPDQKFNKVTIALFPNRTLSNVSVGKKKYHVIVTNKRSKSEF